MKVLALAVIASVALISASATAQVQEQCVTPQLPDVERVSELVHADWVNKRLAEGVTSRSATWERNWCGRTANCPTGRNNWIATP
jgi:hypothetical protein